MREIPETVFENYIQVCNPDGTPYLPTADMHFATEQDAKIRIEEAVDAAVQKGQKAPRKLLLVRVDLHRQFDNCNEFVSEHLRRHFIKILYISAG